MTRKIGIVCGLASEAKIARRATLAGQDATIRVSGASSERAYAAAKELVSIGADVLVSFGVAGGIERDLDPGTVIFGTSVQSPDGTISQVPQELIDRLSQSAPSTEPAAMLGKIVGVDYIVDDPAQKRLLAAQSGALAIDMESHAVAKAAIESRIAFGILRTIADPADRVIPPAAISVVGPNGRIGPYAAAKAVLARPQDLAKLIKLGRDNAAALKSLGRAADIFFSALG